MLDVAVYVSSVANYKKFPRKIACLENFAAGVKEVGDKVEIIYNNVYRPSRLAVILGWATTNTGGTNITLRKQIIAEQHRQNYKTMCIDASCFKYLDNAGTYLRYSIGGPFYDRAEYANNNSDGSKWQEIQKNLGVSIKQPSNKFNGYILIGMQRDGGFSMKTLDPMNWLRNKCRDLRKITQRPIVIRPHPGQFEMIDFAEYQTPQSLQRGITVVNPLHTKLLDNLQSAHSAVFYNSSASVAAVLEGVPVFVDDTSAVTWSVAHHSISQIESPQDFDKVQWIHNLAAAHWTDQDGARGLIYQKFLPFIKK